MGVGPADQAVAPPFFRAYAGSGLVIQVLARNQRTPSRWRVARTVSPATGVVIRPCLRRLLGRQVEGPQAGVVPEVAGAAM